MARQLVFDLPARRALGRGDFFVSAPNRAALAALDGQWPGGRLLLVGPEGAGKTHLTRVWAEGAGAVIIAATDLGAADLGALGTKAAVAVEDADRIAGDPALEAALLHLCNMLAARGGRLLVSGRGPPNRWGLGLPDLASRLVAAPMAEIGPPDDALLAAVLVKHFADRQVKIAPALVAFLVNRIERSFAAAERIAEALDRAALAEGGKVSRQLAARLLAMGSATIP